MHRDVAFGSGFIATSFVDRVVMNWIDEIWSWLDDAVDISAGEAMVAVSTTFCEMRKKLRVSLRSRMSK